MKRRTISILGLVLMLVLLSGCAKGAAHITVQKDGSIDLAVNLLLDSRTQSLLSEKMENMLMSRLQDAGIQLQKSQDGKTAVYGFLKSYASLEELRLMSGNLDIVDTKVNEEETWFYTKYDVEAQHKLNAYSDRLIESMGTLSLPEPLIRMLMQSVAFDFKLTMPINVYGANNATEQDGRTLTWHITLADSEPVRLVVYAPNIINIAIAAGSGVVVLVLVIVLWIRRKRRGSKPKSS